MGKLNARGAIYYKVSPSAVKKAAKSAALCVRAAKKAAKSAALYVRAAKKAAKSAAFYMTNEGEGLN
ncbi:hypothetical protein Q9L42_021295 (plasmid) [Methylomarinum sp. Ch1-1]|uniref:DUF4398 domain-containing protein n=1 Tax=Methylomarinum roseum TaxID=3067653 RepID=A0AAU7P0V2_9GAMM|nr:hypothetical protein [Methylomarinum sp. Ch1-1]MDP4523198.1 hypothetical protein [Methylomarinum sp. Ch1-1]